MAEGNTELPPKSLIIKGYDVSGFVKADGEPVKDVHVVISSVSYSTLQIMYENLQNSNCRFNKKSMWTTVTKPN